MRRMRLRLIRPGLGVQEWTHDLLSETPEFILSSFTFDLNRPLVVDGEVVASSGHSGYLFEMVHENTEIIAVFDPADRLTGFYVNLNSPPRRIRGGYEVRDWFLDVWVFPDLRYRVLDEDEFDAAVHRGTLEADEAVRARAVLNRVTAAIEARDFPPESVHDFLLRRGRSGGHPGPRPPPTKSR